MNTEKMSHVVSMTANVGVLIGLSLLVYELNQNNKHLQQQAESVAMQIRMEVVGSLARNTEIGRLVYSHLDENPLNAADQSRREDYLTTLLVAWQWGFEQERAAIIQ